MELWWYDRLGQKKARHKSFGTRYLLKVHVLGILHSRTLSEAINCSCESELTFVTRGQAPELVHFHGVARSEACYQALLAL